MATERIVGSVEARYHVPKNQCYPGSRGGTKANVHLHVTPLLSGRLRRDAGDGRSLCGRRPWWPREPETFTDAKDEWAAEYRCPVCVELAERHGIEWPSKPKGTK